MDQEFKGVSVFLERALRQKIEEDGLRLLNGSVIGGTNLNLTKAIAGGNLLYRHTGDVPFLRRTFEKLFKGKLEAGSFEKRMLTDYYLRSRNELLLGHGPVLYRHGQREARRL